MKTRSFRFDGGIADDYTHGAPGESSISKHFDILSYPYRLQPLRGMATESVTDSKIGNIIVGSDGLMYGVGTDPSNPTLGKLWQRSGYGGSDVWQSIPSTNQLSGAILRTNDYAFLVDYASAGNARTVHWASTNLLVASDPAGGSSAATQALTFTTISQGFVHPKDKVLYFGYQTTTATYVAAISPNATPFTGLNTTALQLPKEYRVYSLTNLGNYLAIGCTATAQGSGINTSVVFLWDRDTSLTTVSEVIPWGAGQLKVLNNIGGLLVGVNTLSANYNGSVQDADSIQIKVSGGAEPELVKEITATRLTTTAPSCVINSNINFIYRNRLYFSVNIVNGGTAPAYYGLWSFGKTKTGRYAITIERVATNANTETGVLAAAIAGDFVSMAHTAVGTLTYSQNSSVLSTIYDATSVFETCVNPEMDDVDRPVKKKLVSVYATYLPLPAAASVVFKYRADASANGSWTTIFTETTDSAVITEFPVSVEGRNFEFRLESVDGAIILDAGYRYTISPTNI